MRLTVRQTAALLIALAAAGGCQGSASSTAPEPLPPEVTNPGVPGVIITELMADPSAVSDDVGEYIEVFNPGTVAVEMQGWRLVSGPTGAETHTIATSFIVPPCSAGVLVRTSVGNGGVATGYAYGTSITLNNSTTDFVVLRRADNTLVDSVSYSSRNADGTVGTPTYAPSAGISIALVNPALDNTNIAGNSNWGSTPAGIVYGAGDRGTPGVAAASYAAACGAPPPVGPPAGPPAAGVASVTVAINEPRAIPVGFTKPAFPTVRDASSTILTAEALTWTTSDPAIATVDALGYVTAVQPGTVTVRATATNGVSGANSITILPASAATTARYGNHLEFGAPADATPADEQLIARTEFTSSWNRTRGTPNWTSWNLNASQFGTAERCDCFTPDPLTPGPRVVDFDYRNSGYDRGHLVQSESRTATYQENAATFLLTNIIPQAANNNQGPWLALENYLNDLVRTGNKQVYVIAGGEYAPGAPSLKGEGRVLVPDYTWKVAVVRPAGAGLPGLGTTDTDVQIIAARFPNRIELGIAASAAAIRNTPWQSFQTTVDAIEMATGYDLLASLPNDIEAILESGRSLGAPGNVRTGGP